MVMLLVVLCILVSCTQQLYAQENFEEYKRRFKSMFETHKKVQACGFEEYRKRLNAEYALYMRQAWSEYNVNPAKPVPQRKEPIGPVVKTPREQSELVKPIPEKKPIAEPGKPVEEHENEVQLPFDNIVVPDKSIRPLAPVISPETKPVLPTVPGHTFSYYGMVCKIAGMNSTHSFSLKGVKEDDVADAWEILSGENYLPILSQCDDYRKKLNLCDWGYVRFLQEMTTNFFSVSQNNEAVLLQIYLLVQSGYKVRMARTDDNRLVMLIPIEHDVYNYSYLTVDGISYYVIDKRGTAKTFYLYNRAFSKEISLSLYMPSPPILQVAGVKTTIRTLTSKKDVSVTIETDKNIIDFYNDYPISSQWGYYSMASLSENIKQGLYPILQKYMKGLSKVQSVDLLLNFVQTAFEYKTDGEQFGYERPLFGDETLYYPYCDCEDRSILFSIFVRDLLGLDVVLLNYPNHLSTAVKFDEDVNGDHVILDGDKYVICDPTYIGAGIGDAMPSSRNKSAIIHRIINE
ncbi:MAG: hypothetical protein J6B18_07945 [Bacteroidaceae bacterium]|nr:hypothetical protein [Bacteroidaceae bacterium]